MIGGLSARLQCVSDDPHGHAAGLLQALAQVPDPRDPRGRVHALPSLLAVAVSAVAAGQRSVSAIGEWAADPPAPVLDRLQVAQDQFTSAYLVPDASTIGRVLARVDADALDTAISRWLITRTNVAPTPGRRLIAVDGKTLRGSGRPGGQVHLLAALDKHTRRELLNRTLIWNQAHMQHTLLVYERHHNRHRPSSGGRNARPPQPLPEPLTEPATLTHLRIPRHDRLGGLVHEYDRAA